MLESDGDGFFRPTPNPDAQPAPAAVDELPAPARRPAGESGEGGGEEPRRGSQYDFYTVLPGREVPMTDAELAATQREEAERLARQQQEAAAAANSEDAAELALPAPVATDSPSTQAAEPQPAPARPQPQRPRPLVPASATAAATSCRPAPSRPPARPRSSRPASPCWA